MFALYGDIWLIVYGSYQFMKFFLFIAFGDKQIFGGLAGFIVSFLNLIEKNYICQ